MKIGIFVFAIFAAAIFSPEAHKMIGEGWMLHPFSMAITTMIIMFFWLIDDCDTPRNYNRRKGKGHRNK